MKWIKKLFPFLAWFPYRSETLRADLIAGMTVAMVLIPQSMAYAQLAGMPAYYGLYAAFLPVMVAAMWGSSPYLATGPVAIVSLLSASTLSSLATIGSEAFIGYAIVLAFLVGLIQLFLGLFRLGLVVNFLSHPVIIGFTNAAALIIALSQVNKLFGLSVPRSDSFLADIWALIQQLGNAHIPTMVMGVLALVLLWALRRYAPKWPGVLIVVATTTLLSWLTGFERQHTASPEVIADAQVRQQIAQYQLLTTQIEQLNEQIEAKNTQIKELDPAAADFASKQTRLRFEKELIVQDRAKLEGERKTLLKALRTIVFQVVEEQGQLRFYRSDALPAGVSGDGREWKIVRFIGSDQLLLSSGGEVVGKIPEGLPEFNWPQQFSWEVVRTLLSSAFVIALVAFMEAVSIAKALAVRAKERVDANQELIGQGLANIAASISQAFPVSGSFSRSAVNFNAGAKTGMSSVFSALLVMVTLLFFTPLLYHLPQTVLAAVIIMAVIGLINFAAIRHAWQASRHDGIAAIVTFVATLLFAPHLDQGILVGAGLAIGLYLYRSMRPRVAVLGRHSDGTLRDVRVFQLPESQVVVAMRFDGPLYFANTNSFEEAVQEVVATHPQLKYLVVVGDGINELDASGEEMLHHLINQLRGAGITILFSGLKKQVRDVLSATGLDKVIGEENLFATSDAAIEAAYAQAAAQGIATKGTLLKSSNPSQPNQEE